MGTEIKRRRLASGGSELSVTGMLEAPDKIQEIHQDFIEAGSDVILTNTYVCNSMKLSRIGLGDSDVTKLNILAVKIARNASGFVSKGRSVVIAGSMGPTSESYNPDAVPPYEDCLSAYRAQSRVLADEGVDLILVETCTTVSEARAGVAAAIEAGMPVWAALVVDANGRVKGGGTVARALKTLTEAGASAFLINCTQAPLVALALEELSNQRKVPIGVYAQGAIYGGSGWDFEPSMSPKQYLEYAKVWVALGARVIGGCCGTTPEHIRALKMGLPHRIENGSSD
jgi:methionine synthase I (cobalamin-dependent)